MYPLNLKTASPADQELFHAAWEDYDEPDSGIKRATAAIAAGADIKFVWEDAHEKLSILGVLVENFCQPKLPMLRCLLDHGANPLCGELHSLVNDEEVSASELAIDAAIAQGHRSPSGQGVLHELFSAAPRNLLPELVDYAISHGADLSPPEGSTWVHVVLQNPDSLCFSQDKMYFDASEPQVSWQLLEIALELGVDPSIKNAQGQTALDVINDRLEKGCNLPENETLLGRIQSSLQGQHLDQCVAPTPARPARRF